MSRIKLSPSYVAVFKDKMYSRNKTGYSWLPWDISIFARRRHSSFYSFMRISCLYNSGKEKSIIINSNNDSDAQNPKKDCCSWDEILLFCRNELHCHGIKDKRRSFMPCYSCSASGLYQEWLIKFLFIFN